MARTFSRASRNYTPGTYGPFSLDSFTNASAERLVARFTYENWPQVESLFRISMRWSDGSGMDVVVSGSAPVREDGTSPNEAVFSVGIKRHQVNGELVKRAVIGATVTVEVFQTFRTAISLEVI